MLAVPFWLRSVLRTFPLSWTVRGGDRGFGIVREDPLYTHTHSLFPKQYSDAERQQAMLRMQLLRAQQVRPLAPLFACLALHLPAVSQQIGSPNRNSLCRTRRSSSGRSTTTRCARLPFNLIEASIQRRMQPPQLSAQHAANESSMMYQRMGAAAAVAPWGLP